MLIEGVSSLEEAIRKAESTEIEIKDIIDPTTDTELMQDEVEELK